MLKSIMKKLEQGITEFKEFIDENCYFVDKTHLIGYLIDHPSKVHLITRPRRFGKTLNLSMIRYFFEAPHRAAVAAMCRPTPPFSTACPSRNTPGAANTWDSIR